MIRVGERTPLAQPRRLALGVDKWMALQRAEEATGLRLPQDVRLQIEPADAVLAAVDLEAGLADATTLLRDHGVIDEEGPVPAVAANLAALGVANRRVRVSLAGQGVSRLGYHWVDAHLGGSLVRDRLTHTLSLFDARALGTELLDLVPEPESPVERREAFTVPLAAVGPLAAVEPEVPGDVLAAMGEFVDLHPRDVTRLHEWTRRTQAVLHVTVAGRDRAHEETDVQGHVNAVLTAGSPVDDIEPPPDVHMVSLVNEYDIVPRLDGESYGDKSNHTTIVFEEQNGGSTPNHALGEVYVPEAGDIVSSDDAAVVDALAGLGNLGGGSDSTVTTYQMERG